MKDITKHNSSAPSGDKLVKILEALANPHRLRILAALTGRRNYVSQLAREIEMSRPLLIMHLQRLENAGLVTGKLVLSEDGKAMKFYEVTPFVLHLTPASIAEVAKKLTIKKASDAVVNSDDGKDDGK